MVRDLVVIMPLMVKGLCLDFLFLKVAIGCHSCGLTDVCHLSDVHDVPIVAGIN